MKFPTNVAPLASATTSPGSALFNAAWRSPPAATRIVLPVGAGTLGDGSDVGSAGGVSESDPVGVVAMLTEALPVLPDTLAVIVADPDATALTTPLVDTVATAAFDVDHVGVPILTGLPAASRPLADAWVVCPTDSTPDASDTDTVASVPPTGFTVSASEPTTPSLVALITAVPADTAVTTPDDDTDATLGAELDHVIARPLSTSPWPSFGVAEKVAVWPTFNDVFPLTATEATGATGAAETETDSVPDLPSLVAVMVAVPTPTA